MAVKYRDRNIAQHQFTIALSKYVAMVIVRGLPIAASDHAIYLDVNAIMDAFLDPPKSHFVVGLAM